MFLMFTAVPVHLSMLWYLRGFLSYIWWNFGVFYTCYTYKFLRVCVCLRSAVSVDPFYEMLAARKKRISLKKKEEQA